MLLACGLPLLECVYCLGCARWAWKRCLHTGDRDSATWGLALPAEFEPVPVPRMFRLVMANYEDDLAFPRLLPLGSYGIDPRCVVRRRSYADNRGRVTPYLIYLDHAHADIVLAFRGLNLVRESDYVLLLDNRLGDVDRSHTRCHATAPASCMSLNLAIRYADVINSVVLQDDFLPRTATPLEDIFKSILCFVGSSNFKIGPSSLLGQSAMPLMFEMFEGHLHT